MRKYERTDRHDEANSRFFAILRTRPETYHTADNTVHKIRKYILLHSLNRATRAVKMCAIKVLCLIKAYILYRLQIRISSPRSRYQ